MTYHLAQINIARLIAPIDDPKIAGFFLSSSRSMPSRPGSRFRLAPQIGIG